jgi:hypothetical protein
VRFAAARAPRLRHALALGVVTLAAGCVTTPEYRDPLAALNAPVVKEGPFANQTLRVVMSDNTQRAFRHVDEARGARMGMEPSLDARIVTERLTDLLRTRFKAVAMGPAAPGERKSDLTMIFDARISVGSISFQTTSVELTAIFSDENQQVIDTVAAKGTAIVPYPNFSSRFDAAVREAFEGLTKGLDGAAKLTEYVASRSVARRPVLATGPVTPGALRARARALPGRAWALVVGINNFQHAEPLNAAVNDARAVADALPRLGFSEVRLLLDEQATKAAVERIIYGEFKDKMGPNDRLFVFWAGHGITVRLPRGGEEGYLVPVDGDPQRPELTAIPMDEVRKMGKRVNAKHVFFAIDSCFSGFALTRDVGVEAVPDAELAAAMEEPVVQVLTAGRRGQKAVEEGGHGLFTRRLLDGLRGLADQERRGFVTVTQLAGWLAPRVARDSGGRQNPQYSALEGEGDFVFVLPEAPASR